jgi:hypothetical protein
VKIILEMEIKMEKEDKGRYIYIFGQKKIVQDKIRPEIIRSNCKSFLLQIDADIVIDVEKNIILKNRCGKIGEIRDIDEIKKWDRSKIYDNFIVTAIQSRDIKSDEIDNEQLEKSYEYIKKCEKDGITLENNKFNIDDVIYKEDTGCLVGDVPFIIMDFVKLKNNTYVYQVKDNISNEVYFYDEKYLINHFNKEKKFSCSEKIFSNENNMCYYILDIKWHDSKPLYKIDRKMDWQTEEDLLNNFRRTKHRLHDIVELYDIPHKWEIWEINPDKRKQYLVRKINTLYGDKQELYIEDDDILKNDNNVEFIKPKKELKYKIDDIIALKLSLVGVNYKIIETNPYSLKALCGGKDYSSIVVVDGIPDKTKSILFYLNEEEIMETNKKIYNQFHMNQIIYLKDNLYKYKIIKVDLNDKDFIYTLEDMNSKEIRHETEEFLFLNVMFSS